MKRIIFVIISYFYICSVNADMKNDILPNGNTIGISGVGVDPLNQVILYFKDFIFYILGFIAIGVFLYFGFKLILAKGNEEEFKKTVMGLIYAIVGLAIIPLAWGVVKIATTLNF
ncbi:MAG: hypothetical protein PHE25_03780 [Candidatus Gracilibacteria bacterium]|nr:hypothetical protein [Candidatus Gracilibacteria bacterium]